MRLVLELFLISAMVLGSALGAQEENGVLVLDVYSVNVPSDVIHEKGFALWAKALKGGEQSSHEYVPVIHSVYRLGGAVYIDKHYKTGEGNEEQISVVGRVNPEQGGVEYRVEFSELGRPPSIVSYARPLQRGWNCCNTESTISSGTCGAGFSFNPAAADWADGYKLRGAKSQVCDRQERRSAT
jgi:hypothetical protein